MTRGVWAGRGEIPVVDVISADVVYVGEGGVEGEEGGEVGGEGGAFGG